MFKNLIILLIVLSIILTSMGGLRDIYRKSNNDSDTINFLNMKISKQHLWNDGLYLLLLSITLMIFYKIF